MGASKGPPNPRRSARPGGAVARPFNRSAPGRRHALESPGMIVRSEYVALDTPTGPMRTHVYAPADATVRRRWPGLLLYPEIYQQTGPIVRLSLQFARSEERRVGKEGRS